MFDDRVGQFRKVSVREMLRVQGMPESFQFPSGTSHANATALIGKGMDGHAVTAFSNAISAYLYPHEKGRTTEPSAFLITPLRAHENHGHMAEDKSKAKGIPYPKGGCPVCTYGKMKNSPSTGKCRPKADSALDEVFCDIKSMGSWRSSSFLQAR